jgi:hypothetical protein
MKPQTAIDELLARKNLLETRVNAQSGPDDRLRELRTWQTARLSRTYADLRADPQFTRAVDFFLSDLYGPQEFTSRDRDLARAWSYLKRTLPQAALDSLTRALELQVLTIELDLDLVAVLPQGPVTQQTYEIAYRTVGKRGKRVRQIDLIIAIGETLNRIVRHAWIGLALRAAHTPAHAAGFGALQDFLERGFAAFREMNDAQRLLRTVRDRETRLMDAILGPDDRPVRPTAVRVEKAND